MKVVIFIRNLAGVVGGAERGALDLGGALVERGHDITIVTYDKFKGPPHYPIPRGVDVLNIRPDSRDISVDLLAKSMSQKRKRVTKPGPVKEFWNKGLLKSGRLRNVLWDLKNARLIKRLNLSIAEISPDVVVAFMSNSGIPMARTLKHLKIPGIFSIRITPEFDLMEQQDDLGASLKARAALDSLDSFAAITVQVPEYIEMLPVHLQSRTLCIPNEVNLRNFSAVREIPLDRRPKKVLFVGRLVDYKRPDLLLRAWCRVAAEFPGWQLHYYGEGPEYDKLSEFIKEKGLNKSVFLQAFTKDIQNVYREAQIFCLPSLHEGFPRALSEAMASGLAVIGMSDCVGARPLLTAGGRMVVSPNQEEELAEALSEFMDDTDLRKEYAAKAMETIVDYAPDKIFDQWERIIAHVAKKPRGSDPNKAA